MGSSASKITRVRRFKYAEYRRAGEENGKMGSKESKRLLVSLLSFIYLFSLPYFTF